jgi:hypothetical protein
MWVMLIVLKAQKKYTDLYILFLSVFQMFSTMTKLPRIFRPLEVAVIASESSEQVANILPTRNIFWKKKTAKLVKKKNASLREKNSI